MEDDPTYQLSVARVFDRAPQDNTTLREAVAATLRRHDTRSATLSVALVDDAHMADLNDRHLGHSGPTDVLTFDLIDDDTNNEVGESAGIEGEVVISVETAAREARARGHTLDAELALYAVHGTLHLLGYDDHNETDAARMHAMEDDILIEIGLGAIYGEGRS